MTITVLISNLPSRTQDQNAFDVSMAQLMTDLPLWATQVNATAAAMNVAAAGGTFSIPYTFSTTTTDADPGAGFLRLSNSSQEASTVIRLDLVGSDASTWTGVIDTFDDSTSASKGTIRLVKATDPTKWIMFTVSSLASPSGYKNLTVIPLSSSGVNPFTNADPLMLYFSRTGDIGPSGTILRRTFSTASGSTPTPDINNYDLYVLTALATAPTFGAPTGTPADGQGLMFRMKDNGTARSLAWNAIYRASTDLALPSTTVINKTLYAGFIYNAADSKWDLLAVLNNV